MRLIVCGGRNYTDHLTMHEAISGFIAQFGMPSEIVSGAAPGADKLGEDWAAENGVPVRRFPANWSKHGRRAGPLRNTEMAEYADACLALPGGAGTSNMIQQAAQRGLIIMHHS